MKFFKIGSMKSSSELYLVTGDTVVEMSQQELASIGIIFKIKGVLRELKIGIHNKFVETSNEIATVNGNINDQIVSLSSTVLNIEKSQNELKE